MRKFFRWLATAFATIFMTILIEPLIHVNVESWAKQRGYDNLLSSVVPDFGTWLETRWFWLGFGLSAGIAVALWIVRLFPERGEALAKLTSPSFSEGAPASGNPKVVVAAPAPPIFGSPTKLRPLQSYSEHMSISLRQIYNSIHESVKDSTTVPSYFKYWITTRLQAGQLESQSATRDLLIKLHSLNKFYKNLHDKTTEIATKDRSYFDDLRPYVEAVTIDKDFQDLINDYIRFLDIIAKNHGNLDDNARTLIQGYNNKIVDYFNQQWKRETDALKKIGTTLVELNPAG